jgi:CRISPR-associated endonuclease/helicase Cas3
MCGQHRSRVIASVKKRLLDGDPVKVVSTQLIEAGVDIDFPVVFRALCGLDSIAQAAGRCNREGSLSQMGKVVVFVPPGQLRGMLRFAEQATRSLLQGRELDLLAPETYRQYFEFFFAQLGIAGLDKFEIVQLLTKDAPEIKVQFKTAAMKFQLIDESQTANVVVRYKDPERHDIDSRPLIEQLRKGSINRKLTRDLQRFTVSVSKHDLNRMRGSGVVDEVSGYFVLEDPLAYDDVLGLQVRDSPVFSPETYIV